MASVKTNLKTAANVFASAKAYIGTLVALGGILLTLSADDNFHNLGIPDTWIGKIAGIGTLLVAFGAIFGVSNRDSGERRSAAKPAAKKARPRKRAARKKVVGTSQVPAAPAVDTPKQPTD